MDKNSKKSQPLDLQGELFPLSPVCGKSVETGFTTAAPMRQPSNLV
jgi:hypothetical protein